MTEESGPEDSAARGPGSGGSGSGGSSAGRPAPRKAGARPAGSSSRSAASSSRGSGERKSQSRASGGKRPDSRSSGKGGAGSSGSGARSTGPTGAGSRDSGAQRPDARSTAPRPPRAADRAGRDPALPDEVTGEELDRHARNDLRSLPDDLAARVARHLVMVGRLIDDDPETAWAHAQTASRMAGRLGVVREAAGIAAYRNGLYAEALQEFRAARRMSGGVEHWAVMADCERGLGRPKKALEMAGAPEVAAMDAPGRVEMRMVAAGARADLGQLDAAIVTLQCPELTSDSRDDWSIRLKYAYADALLAVGRSAEAGQWFARTAALDADQLTDADDRVAEIEGVVFIDLDEAGPDDDVPEDAGADVGGSDEAGSVQTQPDGHRDPASADPGSNTPGATD